MVTYNCSPGLFRLQNQPSVRAAATLSMILKTLEILPSTVRDLCDFREDEVGSTPHLVHA